MPVRNQSFVVMMEDQESSSSSTNGVNREVGGGQIPEDVQKEAKKHASPVVSSFLTAARRGFTGQVIQALKEGGSEQAKTVDKHGRNCLQLAATHGHFETVYCILHSQLVHINATNKRGLTALHDASMEGHARIVLLLLALGADITARTKDGWTCLMSSCSNGHYQMSSILISTGCSVDAETKLGLTALHIAAWKGHSDVLQLLLEAGADPTLVTHNDKTPLQLAQEESRHRCVSILTATLNKNSEEPKYRISSLEGQLRLYQAKLTEALHKHSVELASQQVSHEEELTKLRAKHEAELKEAHQKIEEQEKQTSSRNSVSPRPSLIITRTPPSPTPPPPMLMSRHRYKRRSDGLTKTGSSSKLIEAKMAETSASDERMDGRVSRLGSGDRIKSASYNDLTMEDKITPSKTPHKQRVSGDPSEKTKELDRKDSTDRLTITDLFEQSLANPCSMSAIRNEIKSDGLTPKIRRKFNESPSKSAKLNSAKLPSVSPKSGLIQDLRNGEISFGKEVLGKTNSEQ